MKRWNSIWLLFFVVLIGCEDNNKMEDTQSEFILAGVDSDKIYMKSYSPELRINFENKTLGDFPTTGNSGTLLIDLNSDNNDDFRFYGYYGYGCPAIGCFMPTMACQIMTIEDKEIEFYSNPLSLNDTIDNNLVWKILGHKLDGELIIYFATLASYTPAWTDSEEIKKNVWITENLYLAVRVKKGDIYKFGWIRLYIDDYYDIKIKEIGFEK